MTNLALGDQEFIAESQECSPEYTSLSLSPHRHTITSGLSRGTGQPTAVLATFRTRYNS